MSIRNKREQDFLDFLNQEGGETQATNSEIASKVPSVNDAYSGTIRISEVIRDLEEAGKIVVHRGRRNPKTNPSGRRILLADPF